MKLRWMTMIRSIIVVTIQTVFGKLKTTYEKRVWSGSIYSWRVSPKLTAVNSRTKTNKTVRLFKSINSKSKLYIYESSTGSIRCARVSARHTLRTLIHWHGLLFFFFFNNSTPLVITSLNVYDVYMCGLMWIRGA